MTRQLRKQWVRNIAFLGMFLILGTNVFALTVGLDDLHSILAGSGMPQVEAVASTSAVANDACPSCPHPHPAETDHTCCCGHFHLLSPLPETALRYSPATAELYFREPPTYLPEVFAELFIPPDNLSA